MNTLTLIKKQIDKAAALHDARPAVLQGASAGNGRSVRAWCCQLLSDATIFSPTLMTR